MVAAAIWNLRNCRTHRADIGQGQASTKPVEAEAEEVLSQLAA